MIKSFVLSVSSKNIDDSVDSHSHKSIKYKRRRDFIVNEILPKLDFIDLEIFNSVTPEDFEVIDDKIIYNNQVLKRGVDWNYNEYPNLYLNSITLSSYLLYKRILDIDSPVLILQDDFFIPDENIDNIKKSIEDFSIIEEPSILYLQSECPWMHGYPIRKYPDGILKKCTDNLSIIDKNWYDLAGNVGYVINKKGAERMIYLIEYLGLSNDDQLTTIAMKNELINVYVSSQFEKMIFLNKNLQ